MNRTEKRKRLNMREIADLAEVSLGTVSRVLKGEGNVDSELCRRTLAVIDATGYEIPKNRRRKRFDSSRIAVVFSGLYEDWLLNREVSDCLKGLENACRRYGFERSLHLHDDVERIGYDNLKYWKNFDGLLIWDVNAVRKERLEQLNALAMQVPTVGFGMNIANANFTQVTSDDYGAGVMVTEELLKRGHRRIAFLNPESSHQMFLARAAGYQQAMKMNSLGSEVRVVECSVSRDVKTPEKEPPVLDAELDQLLHLPQPPTAVIIANDWNAIGFYRACTRCGIRIPEDLSVIGFDDAPEARGLQPSLSSVSNPLNLISEVAIDMLKARMDVNSVRLRVVSNICQVPGCLIVRDSVKKL